MSNQVRSPSVRARATTAVLAVVFVVALAACSSPPPALYTIAPVPGQTQANGPKVVVLRDIALARYLQREQIVRSSDGYRLDVMSNDWWGEPLSAMLARVLVDELNQRLPQSTVLRESGAVAAPADATIEINIERLDEDASGKLVLSAQAIVEFQDRRVPQPRSFRFVVPTPSRDTPGEVAAISTAVGQLADGLASMLAARPPTKGR